MVLTQRFKSRLATACIAKHTRVCVCGGRGRERGGGGEGELNMNTSLMHSLCKVSWQAEFKYASLGALGQNLNTIKYTRYTKSGEGREREGGVYSHAHKVKLLN